MRPIRELLLILSMLRRVLRSSLPIGLTSLFADTSSSDAGIGTDPRISSEGAVLESSTHVLAAPKESEAVSSPDSEEFTVRSMTEFCLNENYSGSSLLELSGRLAESAGQRQVKDRIKRSGELVQRTPLPARKQLVFESEVEAMISDQLLVNEVVRVLTGSRGVPNAGEARLACSWSELREEYPCSICLDVLVGPHNLKCGHSFCFECPIPLLPFDLSDSMILGIAAYMKTDYADVVCCPICRDEVSDEGNYERKLDQIIVDAVEHLEDSEEKELWLNKHRRTQSTINRRRLERLREREGGSLAYTVFSAVLVIIMATFLVLRRR